LFVKVNLIVIIIGTYMSFATHPED